MNARDSASFCHCPKLTSTPSSQVGVVAHAAHEAELADRGTDVLREAASGCNNEYDRADLGVEADRYVDDRAHVGRAEESPRECVPDRSDRAAVRDRVIPLVRVSDGRGRWCLRSWSESLDAHLMRGNAEIHEEVTGRVGEAR